MTNKEKGLKIVGEKLFMRINLKSAVKPRRQIILFVYQEKINYSM